MRQPLAITAERNAGILALLEERPYTTGELGSLFGLESGMNMILLSLSRAGQVQRFRDGRWALAGTVDTSPAAGPDAGPAERTIVAAQVRDAKFTANRLAGEESRVYPKTVVDRELEVLDDEDDADPIDLDDADTEPAPPPRVQRPRPRPVGPKLRQPHERPGSSTIPKNGAPAWWVYAPRDGFTASAEGQTVRMRRTKEYHQAPNRFMQ